MAQRLTKSERETLREIVGELNSEDYREAQKLFREELTMRQQEKLLDWPLWSAGENMPGYMPDSPYCIFTTERAARGYCRELESDAGRGYYCEQQYVTDIIPTSLRECFQH